MTLYELTKAYGEGKGENTMWSTLSLVSDAIESSMPTAGKKALLRKVYGVISGGHYNEEFAHEDIAKMYYVDDDGEMRHGPYWTDGDILAIYNEHRDEIPDYNCWDFAVTMNMVKSDNCQLLSEWFPDDDSSMKNERIVQLAINWLDDEDNPFGSSKIWYYLNRR